MQIDDAHQHAIPAEQDHVTAAAKRGPARQRGGVTPYPSGTSSAWNGPAHAISAANFVTIPLAAAVTGYSEKAIRRKIETAVWLEGREFVRAPDGHVLINLQGYHSWVARGRA